ncbi:MAG: dihydroorotate dehydrogenase electron transfer subunit [Pirellulaceae bacterium]|nr:dihydroorotate dehydrogenase electron transfer subunit [Pirellulaceae bacterium]
MSSRGNPLHAACYADDAVQRTVPIVSNVPIAADTFRLRVACPEIARRILPGQFLMVRLSGCNDPLIGRPLAMYDVGHSLPDVEHAAPGDVSDPDSRREPPRTLDVVYLVKGKFTQRLALMQAGQLLDIWGPLGNGFPARPAAHLILVAGGIGQTPFLAVAKEALGLQRFGATSRPEARADRVTLCYGARRADLLAGLDDFQQTGVQVQVCTDDGSRGRQGLVTDLLLDALPADVSGVRVLACGPEPMLEAVARIAGQRQVPCEVSLETPMACGIGICFTCVARVRDETGQWDYKRTCVEGPVFDAEKIVW